MQFRLTEGNGECRYLIGVNDNGTLHGLKEQDLNETIKIINMMSLLYLFYYFNNYIHIL